MCVGKKIVPMNMHIIQVDINTIFGLFVVVFMGFFCYMSAHVSAEYKEGKRIPLPWEKK